MPFLIKFLQEKAFQCIYFDEFDDLHHLFCHFHPPIFFLEKLIINIAKVSGQKNCEDHDDNHDSYSNQEGYPDVEVEKHEDEYNLNRKQDCRDQLETNESESLRINLRIVNNI